MTENYSIEFNDVARQEAVNMGFEESDARRYVNRLNRDNIALIVVLESLSRGNTTRNSGRSMMCVVNTHLYSNYQRSDVKLWQTMNLIREVQQFISSRDLALILCGDFNSEPTSAVYDYIMNRSLNSDYPELDLENKVRVLPDLQNIIHNIELDSIMNAALGNEPSYTNYTSRFKGTLDYIFFSPTRFRVMAVTSMPEENELQAVCGEGLPASCYPSDHVLLCCDIAMITSGSGAILNSSTGNMNGSMKYNASNGSMKAGNVSGRSAK